MKRDLDFLRTYHIQNKYKGKKNYDSGNKTVLIMIVSIVLIFSAGGGMFGYSKYLENELDELQQYVGNSEYVYSYGTVNIKEAQYEDVKTYNDMVLDAKRQIQAIPQLTNLEYTTLKNCLSEDMLILSMSYSNGIYIITFAAPMPRKVPEYIENIKDSGVFERVSYNGYIMRTYTNLLDLNNPSLADLGNIKQYVFTATCTLKSGVRDEIK